MRYAGSDRPLATRPLPWYDYLYPPAHAPDPPADPMRLTCLLTILIFAAPAAAQPRAFHFVNDIEPLLSRYGCNSSGCHGKAEGQNGFKLSVFGFDAAADFAALTKEARGRRIFPAAPEASLLLGKMSGAIAHGGGVRVRRGSD